MGWLWITSSGLRSVEVCYNGKGNYFFTLGYAFHGFGMQFAPDASVVIFMVLRILDLWESMG